MARSNLGRWLIIAAVTLGALWYLIPTYYSFFVLPKAQRNDLKLLQSKLPRWAPSASHRLNLGLDLQGGIHMVMRVDTQTALQKRVERRGLQIVNYLRDQKIEGVTYTTEPERLELTLKAPDPATLDKVEKELKGFDDFTRVGRAADSITYQLKDTQVSRFREEAVDQAMLVIRRRIDKWGVAEVDVRKMGTDSIQILAPRTAGSRAGQGAHRHHRPARVPDGRREEPVLQPAGGQAPAPGGLRDSPRSAQRLRPARGEGPRDAARLRQAGGPRRSAGPAPVRQRPGPERPLRQLPRLPGGQGRPPHR